jgi:hypothetical protein
MPDDVKVAAPAAPPVPAPVAPPVAAPVAPPSPADALKDLKSKLDKNLGDSSDLAKQAADLKQQVAELQKFLDQNASAAKTYGNAVKGLSQRQAALQEYHDTKKTMLEATLKDKKDAVVKTKQAGDQEVADLQTKVNDLQKTVAADATAYAAAQAESVKQQDEYDKVVGLPSRGTFWVNDSSSLRDAAESQKNLSRAYFLILEMEDSFKKTNLLAVDDFSKQLDDSTSRLTAAKNGERDKKQTLDQDTANLQQAQKEADDANTKRRDNILKSIPDEAAAAP